MSEHNLSKFDAFAIGMIVSTIILSILSDKYLYNKSTVNAYIELKEAGFPVHFDKKTEIVTIWDARLNISTQVDCNTNNIKRMIDAKQNLFKEMEKKLTQERNKGEKENR